jgi:rSAM/selenodomain-associated transferase 2
VTGTLISVVIPTLNEATRIGSILDQIAADGSASYEIVVADGGSTDRTVAIARSRNTRVVSSPPGRGHQIAAGAVVAAGDILWFVHADSKVAPGSLAEIRRTIGEGGKTGGNFRVVFDGTDGFADWLTGFYAWFRRRGLYYGDSGVFIRRDVYDAIGGMHPMALMEDYDFTRRMERFGDTCCIDAPPIVTSSRKFHGRKPIGIVLGWIKIHALYSLGVSPDRLARMYYNR